MHVTARADYALRAMAELAGSDLQPVKAEAIATAQGIPPKFLETIMVQLKHAGLVTSQRGADGGYRLARPGGNISLADVIRAVEGPLANVRGLRPEDVAYEGPAWLLRDVWIAVRANLRMVLERVTLADLQRGVLPTELSALLKNPDAWRRRP